MRVFMRNDKFLDTVAEAAMSIVITDTYLYKKYDSYSIVFPSDTDKIYLERGAFTELKLK